MQIYLRKYGTSATCDFSLYDSTALNILTSAVFSPTSCIISRDGGTSAYSTNVPVVRSNGFSIDFTSSELTTKRMYVKLVDPQWLATSFICETYGTSGSFHQDIASGLLQSVIDGNPIQQLFTEMQAFINGWIVKLGNQYQYLGRDNSTPVFTLSAAPNNRLRV